jgi:hypothetical protein
LAVFVYEYAYEDVYVNAYGNENEYMDVHASIAV